MRKYGNQHNRWVSEQMSKVDSALKTCATPELIDLLHQVDKDFKAKGINPGTTADLTVATVLVIFLDELLGFNQQNR
jgi:triphosphoribosyl-dephospho-CoA synthase